MLSPLGTAKPSLARRPFLAWICCALMAFNLANPIGTGTDAELLEFTRAAIARITALGSMRTDDGRMLTEANLKDLREQVTWLEQRIAAAESTPGRKTNYVGRRRPN